jgi:Tol biopolymer transport system component
MRSSPARSRRLTGVGGRALSLLGVAVLLLLVTPSPASAVYSGVNGRVAYTLYPNGPNNCTNTCSDIYTVAPNGTGTRRLTFDGQSSHPRWNFGGGLIAFQRGTFNPPVGSQPGGYTGDVYVMNANGSGVHRVTNGAAAQQPVWSPKSTELMFIKVVSAGNTDLFRVPVGGGALTRVTFAAAHGCSADHPSWRGNLVVYHRVCANTDEIRLLDLNSQTNRIVLSVDRAAGSMSWPDFTRDLRIMFLACLQTDPVCHGTENVHVVNQDGSGLTVLTHSAGCCGEPRFLTPVPSPDGTTYLVASGSGREGEPPFWELGGPGDPPNPLLHSGTAQALEPDWQRISGH